MPASFPQLSNDSSGDLTIGYAFIYAAVFSVNTALLEINFNCHRPGGEEWGPHLWPFARIVALYQVLPVKVGDKKLSKTYMLFMDKVQ